MADAAAVASILGIASFGIQLTQTLYTFGCNVSSAREESNYIARHVDLYSNVLDILTDRLEDEEPILSSAAFDLIDELQYQSQDLFLKIEQSLPSPKNGKDDISFLKKVKWNVTKSRVALLVGELDYLRSTVHLLVTIIFTGRKIRSRSKRKAKSDKEGTADLDKELSNQGIKAQNALLAQQEAQDKLPELETEATRQENLDGNSAIQAYTQRPNTRTDLIRANATALDNLQLLLTVYTDPAERQRLVLHHSTYVLHQLLQQWTTVDLSRPNGPFDDGHALPGDQQQPRSGTSPSLNNNVKSTQNDLRPKNDAARPMTTPMPPLPNKQRPQKTGHYRRSNTMSELDERLFSRSNSMGKKDAERQKKAPFDTSGRPPEGTKISSTVDSKKSSDRTFPRSTSKRSQPAQPPAGEALPSGWTKARDKTSGRLYYYDSKTLKSQWERPAETGSADARVSGTEDGNKKSSGRQTQEKSTSLNSADRNTQSPGRSREEVPVPKCDHCYGSGNVRYKAKKCRSCSGVGTLDGNPHNGISCPDCFGEGFISPQTYECWDCRGTGRNLLPTESNRPRIGWVRT
ncbi:hypothetical protein PV11_03359 [Exophiala sideris]|uniref:WW domain-containing protein n=1 Tax=Exophiala sideris TaxID=1016849 RepID=A0A0D1WGD7_9EURO|nr:hypothetical protein PV11_03359 [Exophiala sideris]